MRYLVSSSWDGSVKVWEMKLTTGCLSALPVAEFFDSTNCMVCVALEPSQGTYIAGGNEAGILLIWHTRHLTTLATLVVSPDKRYHVCICLNYLDLFLFDFYYNTD